MTTQSKFLWRLYSGEDFKKSLTYATRLNGVDTPVNISGYAFDLRFSASSGLAAVDATIDNASEGEFSFSIQSETEFGTVGERYDAQVWRTDPLGNEEHFVSGTIIVLQGFSD